MKSETGSLSTAAAEHEQAPTLTLIYRDNSLFTEEVPKMVDQWQKMGGKVKMQAFPAGTSAEDMTKWFEENEAFAEGALLTDETCGSFVRSAWRDVPMNPASPLPGYLDRIHTIIARLAVGGDEDPIFQGMVDQGKDSVPTADAFTKIVHNILESRETMPEKVFLFSDHIRDRSHFFMDWYRAQGTAGQPETDPDDQRAAERFADILAAGGIPRDRIVITTTSELTPASKMEMDASGNWIIIDRHGWVGAKEVLSESKLEHARYFELPLDSFFACAQRQGLLNVPSEVGAKIMADVLEDFKKDLEDASSADHTEG